MFTRIAACVFLVILLLAPCVARADAITTSGSCSSGGNTCPSSGTAVTLGTHPVTGDVLVLFVLGQGSAPSLSGSWTTACTSTANQTYVYYRAVQSHDTSSATVQVTTSTIADAVLYEVANFGSTVGCTTATASDAGGNGGVSLDPTTTSAALSITAAIDTTTGAGGSFHTYAADGCSTLDADNPSSNHNDGSSQVAAGHGSSSGNCGGGIAFSYDPSDGSGPTSSVAYGAVLSIALSVNGYQPLSIWR